MQGAHDHGFGRVPVHESDEDFIPDFREEDQPAPVSGVGEGDPGPDGRRFVSHQVHLDALLSLRVAFQGRHDGHLQAVRRAGDAVGRRRRKVREPVVERDFPGPESQGGFPVGLAVVLDDRRNEGLALERLSDPRQGDQVQGEDLRKSRGGYFPRDAGKVRPEGFGGRQLFHHVGCPLSAEQPDRPAVVPDLAGQGRRVVRPLGGVVAAGAGVGLVHRAGGVVPGLGLHGLEPVLSADFQLELVQGVSVQDGHRRVAGGGRRKGLDAVRGGEEDEPRRFGPQVRQVPVRTVVLDDLLVRGRGRVHLDGDPVVVRKLLDERRIGQVLMGAELPLERHPERLVPGGHHDLDPVLAHLEGPVGDDAAEDRFGLAVPAHPDLHFLADAEDVGVGLAQLPRVILEDDPGRGDPSGRAHRLGADQMGGAVHGFPVDLESEVGSSVERVNLIGVGSHGRSVLLAIAVGRRVVQFPAHRRIIHG